MNELHVNTLPLPGPGRVGLTMAPGRRQRSLDGRTEHRRDLAADLDRLRDLGATDLVCLLDEPERRRIGLADYDRAVAERGFVRRDYPIADQGVPRDRAGLTDLVEHITRRWAEGAYVVIHCAGGLGRAGTVAGCLLRALGAAPDIALSVLRRVRGPRCPETAAQRRVIAEFVPAVERPITRDLVSGAVLGAAIGDALGHPTEFMTLDAIRARFGPAGVQGFELWWTRDGRSFAPYTDDTQMAEQVLRGLLDSACGPDDLDRTMEGIGRRFVEWSQRPQGGHRAPGNACLAGCRALAGGAPWRTAGGPKAGGCGSVMRAFPFGLVFADDLPRAAEWAAAHSSLTHNAEDALGACAAMAVGVARCLRGEPVFGVLMAMIDAAWPVSPHLGRNMLRAWDEAARGVSPDETLSRLLGWSAHHAICAAVYLLARHPDDPRGALLEGANSPGDSDSLATLAGALVGARHGLAALPADWVRDVERSEDLLALARAIPLPGADR